MSDPETPEEPEVVPEPEPETPATPEPETPETPEPAGEPEEA